MPFCDEKNTVEFVVRTKDVLDEGAVVEIEFNIWSSMWTGSLFTQSPGRHTRYCLQDVWVVLVSESVYILWEKLNRDTYIRGICAAGAAHP